MRVSLSKVYIYLQTFWWLLHNNKALIKYSIINHYSLTVKVFIVGTRKIFTPFTCMLWFLHYCFSATGQLIRLSEYFISAISWRPLFSYFLLHSSIWQYFQSKQLIKFYYFSGPSIYLRCYKNNHNKPSSSQMSKHKGSFLTLYNETTLST